MDVYTMRQAGRVSAGLPSQTRERNIQTTNNPDIEVQIALNGMDRAIGSAISTQAPKTLDDVKQLTLLMGSFKQKEVKVVQATIPSKLETKVDMRTFGGQTRRQCRGEEWPTARYKPKRVSLVRR